MTFVSTKRLLFRDDNCSQTDSFSFCQDCFSVTGSVSKSRTEMQKQGEKVDLLKDWSVTSHTQSLMMKEMKNCCLSFSGKESEARG